MVDIEEQKTKLEARKQQIKRKERLIKGKEKMASLAMLTNLGKLFVKTNISHLDHEVLIGALLEISEKAEDQNCLKTWKEKSKQIMQSHPKSSEEESITIKFEIPPGNDIKEQLKKMQFKWNSFRSEYYGYYDRKTLGLLLENYACKIETIE